MLLSNSAAPGAQASDPALESLDFLLDKYDPATKEAADTFFTTGMISEAVKDHAGCVISGETIYLRMTQKEFKYEVYKDLQYKWLLKKKKLTQTPEN